MYEDINEVLMWDADDFCANLFKDDKKTKNPEKTIKSLNQWTNSRTCVNGWRD